MAYLEVKKDNQSEEDIIKEVEVPELRETTVKEAKKQLKELGLQLEISTQAEDDISEYTIKEQLPKPGIKVVEGSKIRVEI